MKRIATISLFVTFCILWLFTLTASATDVDYDAVDEAAVPMVAQTELPQAADQFFRAYRQLLIYDHEQYSADYNYDNLVGSLTASSVVVMFDENDITTDYRLSAMYLAGLGFMGLGYDEGTDKLAGLLSARSALGNAVSRICHATGAAWDAIFECMSGAVAAPASWASALGGICGMGLGWAGIVAGFTVAGWCTVAGGAIAVLCILIGDINGLGALYYGEYW